MQEIVDLFISNQPLIALLYLLLITALIDTATGTYAAYKGGTFDLKFLQSFVKTHVLFQVTPILMFAIFGLFTPGPAGLAMTVAAGTMTAAYEASTLKSVFENLGAATQGAGNTPDA
jgi:hypothetical protein